MNSLYWFRSDLRITDNIALASAMESSDLLIAIYILTPKTWASHSVAPCKIQFLLNNLKELSKQLYKRGIPLLIRQCHKFSNCPQVLQTVCNKHQIDHLHFTAEYPLDEQKRDNAVMRLLGEQLSIKQHHQHCVLTPGSILNKQGAPFQVFTPFKKTWLQQANCLQAWLTHKCANKTFSLSLSPDPIPAKLTGYKLQPTQIEWLIGEKAAQKALKDFCFNNLHDYEKKRNFPSIRGTSSLSPYLSLGILSPRQCITAALEACDTPDLISLSGNEGLQTWVTELVWRDFYQHIVHFHPNVCKHKPFRPKTDQIPWSYDKNLLNAWKQGITGFPIVDAGMRQLLQTGWMHNRLRMITAVFFSKILLLDWRLGEDHFMQHLIDGDFAANNGGWQWCASTGTDAVPYFRIFNPTTQSQRFDPDGSFIKQFCPELSKLDKKSIHDPYGSGIQPGEIDYPQPIVDYKAMRQKTLAIFKQL